MIDICLLRDGKEVPSSDDLYQQQAWKQEIMDILDDINVDTALIYYRKGD